MGGGIRGLAKTAISPFTDPLRTAKEAKKLISPEIPIPGAPGGEGLIEPPKREQEEVQAAAGKERRLSRLRRGRGSTILTQLRSRAGGGEQPLG